MNYDVYKEILREFDIKKQHKTAEANYKKQQLYKMIPKLKELEEKRNQIAIEYTKDIISSDDIKKQIAEENLEIKLKEIDDNIEKVLRQNGYSKEYVEPDFNCKICQDTGIINEKNNVKRCKCFIQRALDVTYSQNNMLNSEDENFNTFDIAFYSKVVDQEKYNSLKSPLENIKNIKKIAEDFCQNIGNKEQKNLLFIGNTGTGKTFLSNCIAKEVMNQGFTVLYQTAPILMDMVVEAKFAYQKDIKLKEQYEKVFEVDLLIIDDLGTENLNNMKFTELFNIINTRLLKNKKTVISTNLMLPELANTYDERVISRLIGNYIICKFFGDDIRLKKKKLNE